jgi:hypothetical protein
VILAQFAAIYWRFGLISLCYCAVAVAVEIVANLQRQLQAGMALW